MPDLLNQIPSGEEAYSLAILLQEVGPLERSRIYCTDLSAKNIERAQQGHFSLQSMQENTRNYIKSGGTEDLSSY